MAINKDFLVKNGLQVGGNTSITGSLTAAGLVYPVSDGDQYHAMVTDGTGNLSFGSVDTVESDATNQTGSLIPKGTPVYQTGAAGQTLTIAPSDAADPNTMPSIGVAASDIANGDTGRIIHSGYIKGLDTSAFNEGDRIYVADGGGYQVNRPAGENNVVQFLGVVTKVDATSGSIVVFNTASAYSVPNLNDGNIFIGDSTNTYTTATLDTSIVPENGSLYFTDARAKTAIESSTHLTVDGGTFYIDTDANRIGINDTSPQYALDVTGSIGIAGTEVIDSGGEVVTARLKDSGVTANTYGSASQVPVITIDAKGRITSASTTSVAGVSSFTYNSSTNNLNISTADGGSFDADISAIGGSIQGTLADTKVQYGVNYSGTPQQGSFFFDSLNQKLKVYTGTEFVDAVPAGSGGGGGGETTDAVATFEKYTYSIPSATNAISGTDDSGNQLAYVVDGSQNIELYVNGIKQVEGATNDYVATTGTSVTLTYNLAAGDVVDVQVYELLTQDAFYLKSETFTRTETNTQISNAIADYVPLAGGTMTGPLATTKITVDGTTLVTDSDNNRVGIGTATPAHTLHTVVNKASDGITNDGQVYALQLSNDDTTNGNAVGMTFGHGGYSYTNFIGSIRTGAGANPTGDLTFGGRPSDGATFVRHVTIKNNGRVGIGTTNPTEHLTLTDDYPIIHFNNASNVTQGYIGYHTAWDTVLVGSKTAVPLAFDTDNAHRMVIDADGRVLIGHESYKAVNATLEVTAQNQTSLECNFFNSDASRTADRTLQLGSGDTQSIIWARNGTMQIGTRHNYNLEFIINNGKTGEVSSSAMTIGSSSTSGNGVLLNKEGTAVFRSTINSNELMILDNYNGSGFYQVDYRWNNAEVGSVTVTSAGTTYNTTSDRRLKENIELITDGKEKLLAMKPCTFSFKADEESNIVTGFIAQEMAEVIPEAVTGDPDSERMMSMDYGRITPTIVAALQDALKEIEELKERIKKLEAK
jgi:predicted RecA/RadA family phage recombinase